MREIPGYPNYFATEDGRIYSGYSQRYLTLTPNQVKGYLQVRLSKRTANVHRLIALTYLGPCPDDMQVRHGANGKLDNSVGNLSYGTQSENNNDKLRDGTTAKGEKHSQSRLTEADVLEIRTRELTQKQYAVKFGMSVRMIGKIQRREKWTHI